MQLPVSQDEEENQVASSQRIEVNYKAVVVG